MADKFLVYVLKDPDDGKVYYVGHSTDGLRRAYRHWSDALNRNLGPKALVEWIVQLKARGVKYKVETVSSLKTKIKLFEHLVERINFYTKRGEPLLRVDRRLGTKVKTVEPIKKGLASWVPKKILEIVSSDKSFKGCFATNKQFSAELGISCQAVNKYIKELCDSGQLEKEIVYKACSETNFVSKTRILRIAKREFLLESGAKYVVEDGELLYFPVKKLEISRA